MNNSPARDPATSENGSPTRQLPSKSAIAAGSQTEGGEICTPIVEVTPPPKIKEALLSMQILRLKQVSARIGLKRSTIYDMSNPKSRRFVPSFPKRVHISTRSVGWIEHELDAWLEVQAAARAAC